MFERYTEKARRAIFFARYEASELGSPYIETEYLLLGILREDKVLTSRLLKTIGHVEDLRKEILDRAEKHEKLPTSVDLPLSHECKRVLVHADYQAQTLGHKHIGTEHLLLGILTEEHSSAAKLLNGRGIQLVKVREEIAAFEADPGQPGETASSSARVPSSAAILEFGQDLTERARNANLPALVGREVELERLIQILCQYKRCHAVLVGEEGVGKKSIVYGLAHRIAEGNVPSLLEHKSILMIDLVEVASGTRSRSLFEEHLQSLVSALAYGNNNNLIMFVEGFHTLAGEVYAGRFFAMANVLKPGLRTGAFQCISTATEQEYARAIEKEGWLERGFHRVEVAVPSHNETMRILLGVKTQYENFHRVTYTDEALQYAVFHSNNYIPNRRQPEKSLDLLDEAATLVKLRQRDMPEEIAQAQKEMRGIVQRLDTAVKDHEFHKARYYADEIQKQHDILRVLYEKYKVDEQSFVTVTREDVEAVVARRTRLPIEAIRQSKISEDPAPPSQ